MRVQVSRIDGPAGRATVVDGPAQLVWPENHRLLHVVLLDNLGTVLIDQPLVRLLVALVKPLDQDIWSQLEPDIVAVDDEDQILGIRIRTLLFLQVVQ